MGRTIKLLLYFFLYQLAITGVLSGVYMAVNHFKGYPEPADPYYVVFLLVVQVIFSLCMCGHLIGWKYIQLNKYTLAYYNSPKMLFLSFMLIVGLAFWNNYLSELADLPNTMEDFLEQMMLHPLGVFSTVIMAPVMEELFFRGAIEGHLLKQWKNPWSAIVVSSLLFGLVHGNPAQIPFAFVIGLALGWMYYLTGSLLPGIFMHFVNNGSAVLSFYIMGGSGSTIIGVFGFEIATVLAVVGVMVTVFCVWRLQKWLQKKRATWYVEDGMDV